MITGITSAIWFFAWLFLASDSPAKHRFISDDEKSFINRSLQGQISTDNTKVFFALKYSSFELTELTC